MRSCTLLLRYKCQSRKIMVGKSWCRRCPQLFWVREEDFLIFRLFILYVRLFIQKIEDDDRMLVFGFFCFRPRDALLFVHPIPYSKNFYFCSIVIDQIYKYFNSSYFMCLEMGAFEYHLNKLGEQENNNNCDIIYCRWLFRYRL